MTDWIVPVAQRQLTPNRYSRVYRYTKIRPVDLVVYHFTAGGFDGSLRWLTSTTSKVSAHFLVRKDGYICQLAPLTDRTWHAGGMTSLWRGTGLVNNRSIGIEIENWGQLVSTEAGVKTYNDRPYHAPIFMAKDDSIWDAYPEVQTAAVEWLTRELVRTFPVLVNSGPPPEGRLVGHEHVDPTRKRDPGPAFDWARMLYATRRP